MGEIVVSSVKMLSPTSTRNVGNVGIIRETSPKSGIRALVGLGEERKWILEWIKASDVEDSHLWARLLDFNCEDTKVPHRVGM